MLCTISSCPYSFGLKIPEATGLRELEVWGVLGDTGRDLIGDLVHLILEGNTLVSQKLRDSFFEPRAVACLDATEPCAVKSHR